MKMASLALTMALLAGCSSPPGDTNAPDITADPGTPSGSTDVPATPYNPPTASASGVVEAVDVAARTITIAHGPVDALKWPAMTMTFKAPRADLGSIRQGDHVAFEFTSIGMNGTITTIQRQ